HLPPQAGRQLLDEPGHSLDHRGRERRRDPGNDRGAHAGHQGTINLSIAPHPTTPHLRYVGGHLQPIQDPALGNQEFSGRIFHYEPTASGSAASKWKSIVASAAKNSAGVPTAPHADSRSLLFGTNAGNDFLLETDDGGIYYLDRPENAAVRNW